MALYEQTYNPAELAFLKWMAADDANNQADYRTYREFYDGQHNVPLSDRQKEYLETNGIDFRSNYLRLPVQVLAQRMTVIGFQSDDTTLGGDDGLLWQWWEANRMDALQNNVHETNAVDGDTFILVEWDEEAGEPRFYHERAFDGDEGVKVHYSEAARRKPVFASKRWRVVEPNGETYRRLNIYTQEAIYKYRSGTTNEAGWQPVEEEGKEWPQTWGLDFIPVIPFRHNDDGSNWGRSELEDIIPDQEGLNKSVLDVLEGSDRTAFQIITLSGGLAQNKDGTAVNVQPGQILSHKTGSWGHIPAGDLETLRRVKNDFIVSIAQKSQIPLNYFQVTGQVASDKTQAADDSNMVAKVRWYSIPIGNSWEDVMLAAIRMANEFGNMGLDESQIIRTKWASFERVDRFAQKQTQAALIKLIVDSGGSLQGALQFAEIDPEDQDLILNGDIPDNITQ